MVKYLNVTRNSHNIRCKLYCHAPRDIQTLVLYGHGFGGHKDNKAAERFAQKLLSKNKRAAMLTFDWPAHGDDVKKKISLADCDTYLDLVLDYIRQQLQVEDICGYATSFGGYLFLKHIAEKGSPFRKTALRCPAVPMCDVLTRSIMTKDLLEKLEKGKDVSVGFDRKILLDKTFLEDLKSCDIRTFDYLDYAEDLMILHGTADEVVPYDDIFAFADENLIEFLPVEKADHRFCNLTHMELAIARILEFLELG